MNKKTLLAIVALATATLAGAQNASQNKMVLTTTKAVSETISLRINDYYNDEPDVWIDLNNNGIKDAGEAVTSFSNYDKTDYTLGAQTITIYGNVNAFDCSDNQLTALDVTKNMELEELECGNNQLTKLDVSGLEYLYQIYCSNNQMDACALNVIFESLYNLNGEEGGEGEATMRTPNQPEGYATKANTRSTRLSSAPPLIIEGNPGVPTCNTEIAHNKGYRTDVDGDGTAVCPENNGISEDEAVAFAIYPNPAHATLHVNLPDGMQAHTLTLHDMTGKTVLSQTISGTSATLDIRALSRGLYVVKVGDIVRKLVIK